MSDLRSGKRKDFAEAMDVCHVGDQDSLAEGSEHVPKQHKTFGAGIKPFCAGISKPAVPRSVHLRRQQTAAHASRLQPIPGLTHKAAPASPPPWCPAEMSPQMQALHLKQQHASHMAYLLQQGPVHNTSNTAQHAAYQALQAAAENQLCDAAFTQAGTSVETAPALYGQCVSPGKTAGPAYCWSTSPTAGLTQTAPGPSHQASSPCLDMATSPKPREQKPFQYGNSSESPSPLSPPANGHKEASTASMLGSAKPLAKADVGHGGVGFTAGHHMTDYSDDEADEAALRWVISQSLDCYEDELLRATAEPLPVRAERGQGIVWQNDLDTTVDGNKASEAQNQAVMAASKKPSNNVTGSVSNQAGQDKEGQEMSPKADADEAKAPDQATAGVLNNEDIEVLKALSLKELQAYGPCKETCTLDDLCEDVDHNLQLEDSINHFGSCATDSLSLACSEELIEMEEVDDFRDFPTTGHGSAVLRQPEDQLGKADVTIDEWVMVDDDVDVEFGN